MTKLLVYCQVQECDMTKFQLLFKPIYQQNKIKITFLISLQLPIRDPIRDHLYLRPEQARSLELESELCYLSSEA
jgi:hypothetical protein